MQYPTCSNDFFVVSRWHPPHAGDRDGRLMRLSRPSSCGSHLLFRVSCLGSMCDLCVWHTWCISDLAQAYMCMLRSAPVVAHAPSDLERPPLLVAVLLVLHEALRHRWLFRRWHRLARSPTVRGRRCGRACQTLCGSVRMHVRVRLWSCIAFWGDVQLPRAYAFSPRRDRSGVLSVAGPGTAKRTCGAFF